MIYLLSKSVKSKFELVSFFLFHSNWLFVAVAFDAAAIAVDIATIKKRNKMIGENDDVFFYLTFSVTQR